MLNNLFDKSLQSKVNNLFNNLKNQLQDSPKYRNLDEIEVVFIAMGLFDLLADKAVGLGQFSSESVLLNEDFTKFEGLIDTSFRPVLIDIFNHGLGINISLDKNIYYCYAYFCNTIVFSFPNKIIDSIFPEMSSYDRVFKSEEQRFNPLDLMQILLKRRNDVLKHFLIEDNKSEKSIDISINQKGFNIIYSYPDIKIKHISKLDKDLNIIDVITDKQFDRIKSNANSEIDPGYRQTKSGRIHIDDIEFTVVGNYDEFSCFNMTEVYVDNNKNLLNFLNHLETIFQFKIIKKTL